MIKQRQKESIEIAKKAGKFKGRKLEVTEGGKKAQKASQAIEWYKEGKSINLLETSVRRCQSAQERYIGY